MGDYPEVLQRLTQAADRWSEVAVECELDAEAEDALALAIEAIGRQQGHVTELAHDVRYELNRPLNERAVAQLAEVWFSRLRR